MGGAGEAELPLPQLHQEEALPVLRNPVVGGIENPPEEAVAQGGENLPHLPPRPPPLGSEKPSTFSSRNPLGLASSRILAYSWRSLPLGLTTQEFPEAVGPVGGLGIQAEPRKEFGEGAGTHGLQQERLVRSSHVWEG